MRTGSSCPVGRSCGGCARHRSGLSRTCNSSSSIFSRRNRGQRGRRWWRHLHLPCSGVRWSHSRHLLHRQNRPILPAECDGRDQAATVPRDHVRSTLGREDCGPGRWRTDKRGGGDLPGTRWCWSRTASDECDMTMTRVDVLYR